MIITVQVCLYARASMHATTVPAMSRFPRRNYNHSSLKAFLRLIMGRSCGGCSERPHDLVRDGRVGTVRVMIGGRRDEAPGGAGRVGVRRLQSRRELDRVGDLPGGGGGGRRRRHPGGCDRAASVGGGHGGDGGVVEVREGGGCRGQSR